MKDHEIAQFINELRDVAVMYGNTQQLRERIATVVKKYVKEPNKYTNCNPYRHNNNHIIWRGLK